MKYVIHDKPILGAKWKEKRRIRVIGAGIAGLLAGYFLKKRGFDFEIIEKASTPGGLLGTRRLENGIAEQAANGFLWCREIQDLADDLGLELIAAEKTAKKRFLIRNKSLYRFPLSLRESLIMLAKAALPHRPYLETAADFGQNYFGTAFNQQLLGPGLSGIYAAQPEELSFPGALSSIAKIMNNSDLLPLALIKNRRKNKKATAKNPKGTHSFKEGMGALVDRLSDHLKDHLRLGEDGLTYKNQQNSLLITTPAYQSKHFFEGKLYHLLDQVKYTPLITATLFFYKKDLAKFENGFGCLIPRNEGLQILGVLFNSSIFSSRSPGPEILSLTCIIGDDSPDLELFARSDEEIKNHILGELDLLFALSGQPIEYAVFRREKAIPLYSPQLYHNWFEMDRLLKKEYPSYRLFGNYTGQISIRGMCEAAAGIGK